MAPSDAHDDPRAMLAQLLSQGPAYADFDLFARRPPELGPRRTEVVTYRVRVDLNAVKPPIWRRLELASDLTLEQLHEVLQAAMGWTDSHLHHFVAGPRRDVRVMPFLTDFAAEEGEEGIHERDVRLDQVLAEVGDRLFYEYDFGDGWDHTLKLEAVTAYADGSPNAACTAGRRACPPEDCGGPWGYAELLEAIADPEAADEEMAERLEWLPDGFDPAAFSVAEADAMLREELSESPSLLLDPLGGVTDSLAGLLAQTRRGGHGPVRAMVAAADLDQHHLPDVATRQRMVRGFQHLLELVGEEGLRLTQAGYLPPAVVSRLAAELDQVEPWMGKANREDQTVPVADLRQAATTMGLVRKRKGSLLLTKAGRRLSGDPGALWSHVAAALPLGEEYERHAGIVALLALAAGKDPGEAVRRRGPEVLTGAGWRTDAGEVDQWDAYRCAMPTIAVLDLLSCTAGRFRTGEATEEGRRFGRAALRG